MSHTVNRLNDGGADPCASSVCAWRGFWFWWRGWQFLDRGRARLRAVARGRSGAAAGGTVTAQSGAIVTGAKVTLKGEDPGLSRTTTTNPAGVYSFSELPVGSYTVEVGLAGFKSSVVKGVVINVADVRAVDVQL